MTRFKSFSWPRFIWGILLSFLIGLGGILAPPAIASIIQQQEGSHQLLAQSRQTLKDLNGMSWQVIAFHRQLSNGESILNLRLVGFPGAVELQHPHPLKLTTSMGDIFSGEDITSQIKSDSPVEGNVGQYDLKSVLPQLSAVMPLQLSLLTTQNKEITLNISPAVIEEWQHLAELNLQGKS